MTNQEFIDSIVPGAQKAFADYNIFPSMTIAQAILESGWGHSAPGNMLFGIKWQEGCGYESQLLWTTEYINGQRTQVQDYFRKYNSMSDSVFDHAQFLVNNPRYTKVLEATDYKSACVEIQNAGYATDPNYATTLINIIENYGLYNYDVKPEQKEVQSMLEFTDADAAIDFLASKGKLSEPENWKFLKNYIINLQYVFIKWANDVR